MSKINLCEVRGFGDLITVTFAFAKQEFVPMIKAIGVIALPMIIVALFVKSYVVNDLLSYSLSENPNPHVYLEKMANNLWDYLIMFVVYAWIELLVVAYMKIYNDKFDVQDSQKITVVEVWSSMYRNMAKVMSWMCVYFLIVAIGVIFLIVPGVYLSIGLCFVPYCMVIQRKSWSSGISEAWDMVRGRWWMTFAFLLLLQMIVSIVTYIFSLPHVFISIQTLLSSEVPPAYEFTLALTIQSLGMYVMHALLAIGIGIQFFNILESREHKTLLRKIELMGDHGQRTNE